MAQSTLSLVGADSSLSPALRPYSQRSAGDRSVEYVGTGSDDSLVEPRSLVVSLDVKNPGVAGNNRVNWVFKKTKINATTGLPVTGSISPKGLSIPIDSAWTVADTVDLLKQMACYCGGVAASLSGATDTSGFPASIAKMLLP